MSGFDLPYKVVVVTGARGQLGRPICAALVEAGARVVGMDTTRMDASPYQFAADRMWSAVSDVLDPEDMRCLLGHVVERWGTPSGLLTLAGIDAPPGQHGSDPWRLWDQMLAVNLTGTMNACRVFGEAMAKAGRGSIVTVGSLYGLLAPDQRLYRGDCTGGCGILVQFAGGGDEYKNCLGEICGTRDFVKPAAYSASKGGVIALTRWMAAYWAAAGVRVNCLSPGGIGSDATPAPFRARFEVKVPLGRMGRPDDLAGTLQWLLSDASAYVTGQVISVDGGYGIL